MKSTATFPEVLRSLAGAIEAGIPGGLITRAVDRMGCGVRIAAQTSEGFHTLCDLVEAKDQRREQLIPSYPWQTTASALIEGVYINIYGPDETPTKTCACGATHQCTAGEVA